MACHAIQSWTFTGLVGGFLDLAIAFLLLCGSALVFFASKILGVFGLRLPCPCDGLFGNVNSNNCLQRRLVDYPLERVSAVQLSVKSKFPFDSIWSKDQGCELNLKLLVKNIDVEGCVELEGEGLCTSFSDAKNTQNLDFKDPVQKTEFGEVNFSTTKEKGFDIKGKGPTNQRPRSSLRQRRKSAVDNGNFGSSEPLQSEMLSALQFPSGIDTNTLGNEVKEEHVNYEGETPMVINCGERASHDFELNGPLEENKLIDKGPSFVEEFRCNAHDESGFDGNDKNALRVLEQALEEEQAARAALYLELEKERSAAATAADEAMAMILRLQEEKASVEMEAMQYERLIEEKSAYDAEEMNILKEILLRREREKYFLEKEVEAYRQMMFSKSEQLENGVHGIADMEGKMLNSSEDSEALLHQLSESISSKETVNTSMKFADYNVTSVENQNCILSFEKELPIPERDEVVELSKQEHTHDLLNVNKLHPYISRFCNDCNQEFQEKGVVSMDGNLSAQEKVGQKIGACLQFCDSSSPKQDYHLEKTIVFVREDQEQNSIANLCLGSAEMTNETQKKAEMCILCDAENLRKQREVVDGRSKDPHNPIFDIEPHVHDVHVIDDESNPFNAVGENKSEPTSIDATSIISRECDMASEPFDIQLETRPDICKSSSGITRGLPLSKRKALISDVRRNSMSALDYEKLKIVTEVGWLRDRLRIVQEGREKLNFSVEPRERENVQLQLLEDIVSQLREIRQLTEPGKALRQISLPPPSAKVLSKKRRCRSVSLGVRQSA
ncbi:probable myosin-binding protein 5 [Malania oleifera]|uniref:probable myosin-binding protein 5 n=1 Tax=Malania oleifera TaxID=397392 RepID=UPI0025AE18CE|nr:probable myosin-binding protein 5 [Malania oleifera]XP_057959390.1 probable myosin-binding protein 5 [Malania oleifera]XP_057959391.1 probable myosin-binding protein 5 [Malania oleifera]